MRRPNYDALSTIALCGPTAYDGKMRTVTDDEYRKQLRAEFEAAVEGSSDTPAFRQLSWEYICKLEGIDPDGDTDSRNGSSQS